MTSPGDTRPKPFVRSHAAPPHTTAASNDSNETLTTNTTARPKQPTPKEGSRGARVIDQKPLHRLAPRWTASARPRRRRPPSSASASTRWSLRSRPLAKSVSACALLSRAGARKRGAKRLLLRPRPPPAPPPARCPRPAPSQVDRCPRALLTPLPSPLDHTHTTNSRQL